MPLSALFSAEQLEEWKKFYNDYYSYYWLKLWILKAYEYYSNNCFDSDRKGYILALNLLNSSNTIKAKEFILNIIQDYEYYDATSKELDQYHAALKFIQEPKYFEQFKYIFELVKRFHTDKSFCDNYYEYVSLTQKVLACDNRLKYLENCYGDDSDSMERDHPTAFSDYDNAVNIESKFLIEKLIF